MPTSARFPLICVIGLFVCGQTACNLVPAQAVRQSQFRSMQLYRQKQAVAMERDQASQLASSLAAQKQQLEQRSASMQAQLDTANHRLNNLNAERSQLQQRYVSLLNRARNQPNPLSEEDTQRFLDLMNKYPNFEFDPQTGVSKFHSDVVFASGSAQLKVSAKPLLQDLAAIMTQGDAQRLNILVVGHTDDKRISKRTTKSKHPTNWHLSTNRANAVLLALAKFGIKENRMGAAGYSRYQPVVPNKNEQSRQQNRRVEVYVLAPDAVVARWDPWMSRN
jgi:chemotaxis protein MotB